MHSHRFLAVVLILSAFLFACNPARKLPEGSYLLIKNNIKTDTNVFEKNRLTSLIKQKPNRKILGLFKFHLAVYNIGNSGKTTRFKNWLKRIGEEPVVLDSFLTAKSTNQLNLFLKKQGFFNATVTDSVKTWKKKAKVYYDMKFGRPYYIRNVDYRTNDPNINFYIDFLKSTSLIHPGDRYDEDAIDKERERISSEMKDRGFFFFSKNYVTIEADSSLQNYQSDIFVYINRINENVDPSLSGNLILENHEPYTLRNIYIQTDFNLKDPNGSIPKDTVIVNDYYILSSDSPSAIKNETLLGAIFIKKGDRYLPKDLDYTYKRLQDLNIFKFINLQFTEVPRDENQTQYLLDVNIKLTPGDKQDVTLELEAANSGGNLGVAGSFGWRNKNLFRGAELFEFKVKGALEAIPDFNDSVEQKKLLFFNTYEIGPDLNLTFKKFLLLRSIFRNTSRYFNPSTNLNMGFNFQDRPDYRRSILNFSFGYLWQSSSSTRWLVYPVNINSVYVKQSPGFAAKLDSINDPHLSYSYETHLIPSGRVTWILNNQNAAHPRHFIYVRGNLELAGLILRGLADPLNLEQDANGNYQVFGINFSQYIKPDIDFSYHQILDPYNNVVYRLAMGIGILPFASSNALPFEKSFFAGGANSLRAWAARTLGPGSYKKTVNIEQSGDIKIEANFEYRSFLFKIMESALLEGAAFIDAGNIWTQKVDEVRPGAQFKVENMLKEMGVGAGLGMRFNFNFFILRLDGAVKLRDPSLDETNRWVYQTQKFVINDVTLNLAIGYPF